MKNLLFIIAFLFATANSFSQVYVSGYTKSNGTYVEPHYRTAPNTTRNDNYSTVGNTNPYTGTSGTKPRDSYYTATPTYNNSSSYTTITSPTNNSSYSSPTYSISYSSPTYSNSYSSPTYTTRTVYTGPRGGQYYINSNGNKSYISR